MAAAKKSALPLAADPSKSKKQRLALEVGGWCVRLRSPIMITRQSSTGAPELTPDSVASALAPAGKGRSSQLLPMFCSSLSW
jgi:hypothetical protein